MSATQLILDLIGNDKTDPAWNSATKNALKATSAIAAAWSSLKLGDIVSDALSTTIDQQGSGNMLEAQLGGAGPAAEAAGTEAGRLFSQGLAGSLDEVNVSVVAVTRNLGSVGELGADQFERVTTNAHNLATVMDEDVLKVTAAVSSMMRSGLAPNADYALDIIAKGAELGVDKQQDLLDTFTEYSVQFKQLGLTSETALGIMNQGLEAGARNSDVVADALKEFTLRAQTAMATPIDTSAVTAAQAAIVSATESAAGRVEDATARVATAEGRLVSAQDASLRSQVDLTRARKDATAALADLADQVTGAGLSERGAELALSRAQASYQDILDGSKSTALDIAEGSLRVEQAKFALDEAHDRVAALAEQQADASTKGVEGSDQVVAAQQRVNDSTSAITDAQVELAKAQADQVKAAMDGAAAIAAANANLAEVSTAKLTPLGQAFKTLGLDGEAIGDQVAAGGDVASGALGTVLDRLRDVKDPTERMALAVQLFGTKAEDLQGALFALDPATAADGLDDVANAADAVSESLGSGVIAKKTAFENTLASWKAGLFDLDGAAGTAVAGVMAFGPGFMQVAGAVIPAIGSLLAWRTAQALGTAAAAPATVANVGFAASLWAVSWPILAIIAAIALLALGVYEIVTHWDTVEAALVTGFNWVKDNWPLLLGILTGPFGLAALFIAQHWDQVTAKAGEVWGAIRDKFSGAGDFFGGIGDGIGTAFKTALRAIALVWNDTVGKLDWQMPKILGGAHLKGPLMTVPALADGGVVTRATLALIGEAGPEAVVPLNRAHDMFGGNDGDIVVQIDGREIARVVDREKARKR